MTRLLLILEDEPAIGQMVQRLAQRSGMQAEFFTTPEQFFRRLGQCQPSHLFIDLMMPELDGVEVLTHLGHAGVKAGIIIASGLGGRVLQAAERAARYRGLHVIGVLAKPFSARALRTMLGAPPQQVSVPAPPPPQPALLEQELDRGLRNDEFFVLYQPKLWLHGRRVLGVEALVRWAHPTRGTVGPDEFIPLAERYGKMQLLTDRVIQQGLAWLAGHVMASPLYLEVNLSSTSLDSGLPDRLASHCRATGVPYQRLVLEITETSQVCDVLGATEVLNRLRIRGFGLAIDDFGIGYSSMSQLAMFPFTELKIDRSFVADMDRSDAMRSVVQSSIQLAQQMGMTCVAEGVEQESMLTLLEKMGCDAVQGYAIAPPMPGEQLSRWIRERSR